MNFDFDDALSEDWISQPPSAALSSIGNRSPPWKNAFQSRIPLPRVPSSPQSAASSQRKQQRLSPSPTSKLERPLHRKSVSDLNIVAKRQQPRKSKDDHDTSLAQVRGRFEHRRQLSDGPSSAYNGTVQYKTSKANGAGISPPKATPEWKRRLINGSSRQIPQSDLFSPIGLENVFRPPARSQKTVKEPRPKQPRGVKYTKLESSPVHSSPPPCPPRRPASVQSIGSSGSTSRNTAKLNGSHSSQAVRDETGKPLDGIPQKAQNGRADNEEGQPEDLSQIAKSRVLSGQSDIRHEVISPVQIRDGKIDYLSVHNSVLQLRAKMESLGMAEQERPSSRSSDNGVDYDPSRPEGDSLDGSHPIASCTPRDTLTDSDAFILNGGYITTRRGGYSSDDSFQRRPLSPSSFRASLDRVSNTCLQEVPSIQEEITDLEDPHSSTHLDSGHRRSSHEYFSAGCPLKLFVKHDTFTNDRVFRRLSQFVGGLDMSRVTTPSEPSNFAPRLVQKRQHALSENEDQSSLARLSGKRISSFGDGYLDSHDFWPHGTLHDDQSFVGSDMDDQDNEPSLPVLPKRRSIDLVLHGSNENSSLDSRRRVSRGAGKRISGRIVSRRGRGRLGLAALTQGPVDEISHTSDGKRLLHSPAKPPDPKRRRTVNAQDRPVELLKAGQVRTQSPIVQSIVGKKRKDARYEDDLTESDPSSIASRPILCPKSPHSRSHSYMSETSVKADDSREQTVHHKAQQRMEGSTQIAEPAVEVDASTKMLAEDLANFALDVAQTIARGGRKASVTTADFFKEAHYIMKHLRGQARPGSGHTSEDGSEIDQLSILEEESIRDEDTAESFDRPPSHDGNQRPWKDGYLKPLDARVLSHLRKYQETDDIGLSLTSSMKSLQLAHGLPTPEFEVLESDPPNVRIRNSVSPSLAGDQQDYFFQAGEPSQTRPSHPPSDPSTARTLQTGTSSASSRRVVIAPETVTHLISDCVGRMTFDPIRSVWVKRKSSREEMVVEPDRLDSDLTDEDPFRSIPDLDVDEAREVKLVKNTVILPIVDEERSIDSGPKSEVKAQGVKHSVIRVAPNMLESSALSRGSKLASSGHTAETRPTSLGNATPLSNPDLSHPPNVPIVQTTQPKTAQDKEHPSPSSQKTESVRQKPRIVTVSFSSPLAKHFEEVGLPREDDQEAYDESDSTGSVKYRPGNGSVETSAVSSTRYFGGVSRPKSSSNRRGFYDTKSALARPVSRIEERDEHEKAEVSVKKTRSTDLELFTPQSSRKSSRKLSLPPPSTGRHSSVGFHLAPLPDFTLDQIDESLNLDVDYVTKSRGLLSVQEVEGKFSLAIKDLVEKITDVEPYEPYWEYIRKLELRGRRLLTLHMLDEFCNRIEELDVSENDLGQLNGVPNSLRILNVRNNCLSSLTAWGHLQNLQYLDVSNNEIQSLKGFSALIHLRELKATNNKIHDLQGLLGLSGLLRLTLAGNNIKTIDFSDSDLLRLEDLDLEGNEIVTVTGLEHLPRLNRLNLRKNKFEQFSPPGQAPILSITELDLALNSISTINIIRFLNLRHLNLDSNRVHTIQGIGGLRNLEHISWRDQRSSDVQGTKLIRYHDCIEAQSLYLSSNKLHPFSPSSIFMNLNRLELASAGLESIGDNFGLYMPNLRVLNLNHNAIKDIEPLSGIVKLKELYLVGNRFSRLRKTTSVLSKIGHVLEVLDCRMNPLTIGFYAPHGRTQRPEQRMVVRNGSPMVNDSADDPGETAAATHLLAAVDREEDRTHQRRLDEGTLMRRRVCELLIFNGCRNLKRLNGLDVDQNEVSKRDGTWERLVELKVVRGRGR